LNLPEQPKRLLEKIMSKLKKVTIGIVSFPIVIGLLYATWCVRENYKTGDWSESCGLIFTNPHYRACMQRRTWIPRVDYDALAKRAGEIDLSAGLVPKFDRAKFPTMWVIVDPFQEFGGTFVQPAPSLPKTINDHPCVPGSFLWHEKYQWVCVEDEKRPEGMADDVIIPPLPPGAHLVSKQG
jgi:hypothetical protein